MIFNIIGLCILLYSLARFRKGLILFLIYKIVLVQNITLISIPGIPLLTLDDFMTIAILVIYAFKRKKLRRTKQSFPLEIHSSCLQCHGFFPHCLRLQGLVRK